MADTSTVVLRQLGGKYQRTPYYVRAIDPTFTPDSKAPEARTKGDESVSYRDVEAFGGYAVKRWNKANVLTSEAMTRAWGRGVEQKSLTGKHLPAIDIDLPVTFEDGVLTFEAIISEEDSWEMAAAFAEAGLIDEDYTMEWDGYSTSIAPFACNVTLIGSSTEGHFHLYIDSLLDTGAYMTLLEAMAQAGVVEWGYYEASKVQGRTCLRINPDKHELPWPGEGDDDMEPF